MSLGEIQQIYSLLVQIDDELGRIESKLGSTEKTTTRLVGHRSALREIEYLFYRVTSLMKKAGLPEDIDQAIQKIQAIILTIRLWHSAMIALQSGTYFGLAIGAIGLLSAAFTTGTALEGY